jgi:acyl-CoA thioester hydrolase
MSRIKIEFPSQVAYTTEIPIRITDINYGSHVGNDTILSLVHEVRMQWLTHLGYASELAIDGVGLIMVDAGIEFKSELFYGNSIVAQLAIENVSKVGFDVYCKLEKKSDHKLIAVVKTGILCYDYDHRKIARVPERLKSHISKSQLSNKF